jgi:hypothetical protein
MTYKSEPIDYDERIEIHVNEQMVLGRIVELQDFYIQIEIVYPYANWTNQLVSRGPGAVPKNSYRFRYKKVAEQLLFESYRKLEEIDEKIERAAKVYEDFKEETAALTHIPDRVVRNRIEDKIKHWFFGYFLFSTRFTGLVATIFEERKIRDIFEAYLHDKTKIYKPNYELFPQQTENNKNKGL